MSMFSPDMLIGRPVMFENGHTGNISKIFDLAEGLDKLSCRWIIEVTIMLKERECHFDSKVGVSLTGKRLFPASEIGRTLLILDKKSI